MEDARNSSGCRCALNRVHFTEKKASGGLLSSELGYLGNDNRGCWGWNAEHRPRPHPLRRPISPDKYC